MHETKIKHFKTDHPGVPVPWFQMLSEEERKDILEHKIYDSDKPLRELYLLLRGRSISFPDANAESEDFNLSDTMKAIKVKPKEKVYICDPVFDLENCYFCDLTKYFDDFWYSGPDDIEIFDSSLNWIVFVDHDGYISYLKSESIP
jgi:hypothetical protein